ncbi:hypothetical protein F5884DRAFT_848014 [Xylogone sp. PMI_703]|nr:hypothetical protein F5884DRAFT_848014 [Xylogone sp. PMI_703]
MVFSYSPQTVLSLATVALNITSLFGPSLSPNAEIVLASDPRYTSRVTQRWTVHEAPSFAGAIKPATEEDIQNIIKIASTHKIPFLATGGGHSATVSVGAIHDGVNIDLSKFDSVHFDAENDLLTVGAAVRFEQITDLLYHAGKQFLIGTATCVGMIGATIGAGVGPVQGELGLMIDALESVRMVTASGSIINVSKTENAELFWGIRGAGANFGIITSATYRVPNAINNGDVLNADFLFPAAANGSVWKFLQSVDDTLPSKMTLNFAVAYNQTIDQLLMVVNAQYFGPPEEGLAFLQPLYDIGPFMTSNLVVPWNELISKSFFGLDSTACQTGQYINMYSIGLKETEATTFESYFNSLWEFSRQHPDIHSVFVTHRFPTQAVQAIPDGETAFPHRQVKMHVQLESAYANPALDGTVDAFMRDARAKFHKTSGFEDLSVHVNFAHGDEGPEVWYQPRKLANLTRLKKEWDPEQLFSWFNPVPLNWE